MASSGAPNATSEFVFELGAFNSGFTPLSENLSEWADNWQTFEVAQIAADPGVFGTLFGIQGGMTVDGMTVSEHPQADVEFNFSGLDAYLWIKNGTDLVQGTEWFLGRSDTWVFPDTGLFDTGCSSCPGETPVNWSTSNFASNTISDDVPLFGNQSGVLGQGVFTTTENEMEDFTLQTFGVVPEPSTIILPAIIGLCVFFRRLQKKGRS